MDKSRELLTYYIIMLMQKQGLNVDMDNYYDLDEIITGIQAYYDPQIKDLIDRVNKLEAKNRINREDIDVLFNKTHTDEF